MKLILNQQQTIPEPEVEIRYAELDTQIQFLIKYIEQGEPYVYGTDNGRQYRVLVKDIFYAESVDRKTFIYTESAVFRCELKLYSLLEKCKSADFVQVSKSCVLNVNTLENIKTLFNSRMEGTLINGEKITISRTYIPAIRDAFMKRGEIL